MKRLLVVTFALLCFAPGCGPANKPPAPIDSFFPKDNEVGTWVEDSSVGKAGVEVATTSKETTDLVDGAADPFIEKGMVGFAWQSYVKDTYKLDLRVWQFKSAAAAKEAYDWLFTNASLYKASTWSDLAVGDAGKVADTGGSWWLSARKGAYIIEAKILPKDATSRTDVEAIGTAVAGKIP